MRHWLYSILFTESFWKLQFPCSYEGWWWSLFINNRSNELLFSMIQVPSQGHMLISLPTFWLWLNGWRILICVSKWKAQFGILYLCQSQKLTVMPILYFFCQLTLTTAISVIREWFLSSLHIHLIRFFWFRLKP